MPAVAWSPLAAIHLQKRNALFNTSMAFFIERYSKLPYLSQMSIHIYLVRVGQDWARCQSASLIAASVGGKRSNSARFLWERSHLRSFTLDIGVFRRYSRQTSFSIAAKVSGVGCGVKLRCESAATHRLSVFRNAFQQANFYLPEKLPVTPTPLHE